MTAAAGVPVGGPSLRQMFTESELRNSGLTRSAIRWGEEQGRWRHLDRLVYGAGPEEPSPLDLAVAGVLAVGGVASGSLAGVLHGLDAVSCRGLDVTVGPTASGRRRRVRRRVLPAERVTTIGDIPCTDLLQTIVDLAADLDDDRWEQALEAVLRRHQFGADDLEVFARGSPGVRRIRRVLALRPDGAHPTESLLETLMVQLARGVPALADPVRQLTVFDQTGAFVARVDLAWPSLGLFIELDGQHHRGQPVHDARRETAVVASTGWLCGRFTWREVVHLPRATARRLGDLAAQARNRPLAPGRDGI